MSSPVFNILGNSQGINSGNAISNLMRQFEKFRSSFSGDPRQQVQQLLNSGKVSQADYDRAVKLANQFQQMIKR